MNVIKFTVVIAIVAVFSMGCAHKAQWQYKTCFRYDYYGKQHLTACKE